MYFDKIPRPSSAGVLFGIRLLLLLLLLIPVLLCVSLLLSELSHNDINIFFIICIPLSNWLNYSFLVAPPPPPHHIKCCHVYWFFVFKNGIPSTAHPS
jgi:hypothetical protein